MKIKTHKITIDWDNYMGWETFTDGAHRVFGCDDGKAYCFMATCDELDVFLRKRRDKNEEVKNDV